MKGGLKGEVVKGAIIFHVMKKQWFYSCPVKANQFSLKQLFFTEMVIVRVGGRRTEPTHPPTRSWSGGWEVVAFWRVRREGRRGFGEVVVREGGLGEDGWEGNRPTHPLHRRINGLGLVFGGLEGESGEGGREGEERVVAWGVGLEVRREERRELAN